MLHGVYQLFVFAVPRTFIVAIAHLRLTVHQDDFIGNDVGEEVVGLAVVALVADSEHVWFLHPDADAAGTSRELTGDGNLTTCTQVDVIVVFVVISVVVFNLHIAL